MRRWLMLLLVLFLPMVALAEVPALTIDCQGKVTGFQENKLTIHSERAQTLTLRLEQHGNVWRTMNVAVRAGENVLAWDGLGENEERLPEGKLDLVALTADGWEVYTIRDVSTAAWHATRKDHLDWDRRLEIFAGHLETRMIRCDGPQMEPPAGPVM